MVRIQAGQPRKRLASSRFARLAAVFTCPVSGSRSETRTSLKVMQQADWPALEKMSMSAMAKLLVSAKASESAEEE